MTDDRMPPPSDTENRPTRRRRAQTQMPENVSSAPPELTPTGPSPISTPEAAPSADAPRRRRRPQAAQTNPEAVHIPSVPQPEPKAAAPAPKKPVSAPQRARYIAKPDPVRPTSQSAQKAEQSLPDNAAPVRRRSARTTYITGTPQAKASDSNAPVVRRRHAQASKRRRSKIKIDTLIIIALACVCVFSFVSAARILLRTLHTKSVNSQLSALHEASMQAPTQETEPDTEPVFTDKPIDATAPESQTQGTADDELDAFFAQAREQSIQPTPSPTPSPESSGKFHQLYGDALPEMAALYAQNKDLVGWLNIPDVLDLPVVFRDNTYYLTHNFYGETNASGTLFLDETHPFKEKTQNLLLHGHNMKDGTMFGRLEQYSASLDYLKAHSFIRFDSLWQHEYYVIFAVLHVVLDVNNPNFFDYYAHPTFSSDTAFDAFVRQAQLASQYAIPVDVRPTDALLTLSTCEGDDRLVILARRIRADETQSALRQVIRLASPQ